MKISRIVHSQLDIQWGKIYLFDDTSIYIGNFLVG